MFPSCWLTYNFAISDICVDILKGLTFSGVTLPVFEYFLDGSDSECCGVLYCYAFFVDREIYLTQ